MLVFNKFKSTEVVGKDGFSIIVDRLEMFSNAQKGRKAAKVSPFVYGQLKFKVLF